MTRTDTVDPVAEGIAEHLAEPGWVVVPDFLDAVGTRAIGDLLRQRWASGHMRPAGVGRGRTFQVRPEIRSDRVLWVDNEAPPPVLADFLARMEALRAHLNRTAFLGLHEYECHLTAYPRGAFYGRHLDRFADQARRQVSTVFYLNPDWREQDGGVLRIETGTGSVSVLPEAGTLVLFRSGDFWHEVRRARRLRLSVTGWFLTRPVTP
ncbi:MAG: 2OG-Fe(II) oxygenase [Gammaproteobacteria bacterium]|nr:MAG: 2OG-Fe(II) oxygenase [Gammaproteobacteria bacterium]